MPHSFSLIEALLSCFFLPLAPPLCDIKMPRPVSQSEKSGEKGTFQQSDDQNHETQAKGGEGEAKRGKKERKERSQQKKGRAGN